MFAITRGLCLGPFAGRERRAALLAAGITHVLNVSERPGNLTAGSKAFREVAWYPIADRQRIARGTAIACLEALHHMVCQCDAVVYIHCIAGWSRSPTVAWLYLMACGLAADTARDLIESRAPEAVPGDARLVDRDLVEVVRLHGQRSFLPHPRTAALDPA